MFHFLNNDKSIVLLRCASFIVSRILVILPKNWKIAVLMQLSASFCVRRFIYI